MKHKKRSRSRLLHSPVVWFCLTVLILLTAACLLAPVLTDCDPIALDPLNKFAPMSSEHPMGTDYLGRDIFSRVLWGGRNTLGYACLVTALSALLGTAIGLLCGSIGGWLDSTIMRFSDVIRAFPGIILVFILVSVMGVGIWKICIALLITRWIWYARMARNLTRRELARSAIMASRLAGSRWPKILTRNIFPAILPQMLSVLSLDFGSSLLAISGYSFLGLGILPPSPEWGMMINDGRSYLEHPGMMFWPGLCVVLVVISFNMLGDKLRDTMEETRS